MKPLHEYETPITDKAEKNIGSECGQYSRYIVEPDVARQLEQKLAACREALADLYEDSGSPQFNVVWESYERAKNVLDLTK